MKIKTISLVLVLALCEVSLVGTERAAARVLEENTLGTFLVIPEFDIRGESATQIRIVNNLNYDIRVKLNYVCPGVKHINEFCAALDTTVALTPYQTRIVEVADQNPPCNQGYVVAFAVNSNSDPISYNGLSGSYHIFNGRTHRAENALAVKSVREGGSLLGTDGKLFFGDEVEQQTQEEGGGGEAVDFRAMPRKLFTDFRAVSSNADQGSRLVLLTLDVLAGMQNPPAVAFIDFWSADEVPFSSSHEYICWSEVQLDDIDANFLEENLGTTYGSMRITPFPNCPLPGGCPPLIPYEATMLGTLTEYGDGITGTRSLSHDSSCRSTTYQPR